MARDATQESQLAKEQEEERSAGPEHPVDVPDVSEYPVDTPDPGNGVQVVRRETLYQQADDEGTDPTWEEIEAAWHADPKGLFKEIVEVVQNLRDLAIQHQITRKRLQAQMKENSTKDATIEALVSRQRDATPSDVISAHRTSKLPDPPKFSGKLANGTTFENWLVQVKNKLRGNSDHYQSEDLKVIYVAGLLEGNALALVTSRLDPDNLLYYSTVTELYAHLLELYGDPNRTRNARQEFKQLIMCKDQPFQEFYANFLRLVADGDLPAQDLKEELNDKLSWKLQEAVAVYYNDPSVNVTKLAQQCVTVDQQIRYRAERQQRTGRTPAKPVEAVLNQTRGNSDLLPRAELPAGGPPARRQPKDRSTVKCYACNQLGHYARDCKVKQVAPVQLVPTEQPAELDTNQGKAKL